MQLTDTYSHLCMYVFLLCFIQLVSNNHPKIGWSDVFFIAMHSIVHIHTDKWNVLTVVAHLPESRTFCLNIFCSFCMWWCGWHWFVMDFVSECLYEWIHTIFLKIRFQYGNWIGLNTHAKNSEFFIVFKYFPCKFAALYWTNSEMLISKWCLGFFCINIRYSVEWWHLDCPTAH